MKAFLKNVCLRPSCYDCEFKSLHRHSDITLADFWGVQNVVSEMDDDKGTSLVFVNSNVGQEIFNSISNKMEFKKADINRAVKYNPSAIMSVKYNPNREEFFSNLNKIGFNQLVKKYCTDKLEIRVKRKVKAILRTLLIRTGLLGIAKRIARRS